MTMNLFPVWQMEIIVSLMPDIMEHILYIHKIPELFLFLRSINTTPSPSSNSLSPSPLLPCLAFCRSCCFVLLQPSSSCHPHGSSGPAFEFSWVLNLKSKTQQLNSLFLLLLLLSTLADLPILHLSAVIYQGNSAKIFSKDSAYKFQNLTLS